MNKKLIFILALTLAMCMVVGCASKKPTSQIVDDEQSVDGPYIKSADELEVSITAFTLGPGDKVDVRVWPMTGLNQNILVGPSGIIDYPYIGQIPVTGMSIFDLRDIIGAGLAKYYKDPHVSVNITSNQSQKIFVLGEVVRPGIYQLPGPINTIEAISMANGFTRYAELETVLLIRGDINKPQLASLNVETALGMADMSQNVSLQPGDVLYVPATKIASVDRYFRHLYAIILPIVTLEYGIAIWPDVKDAIKGDDRDYNLILPSIPNPPSIPD
jgi:polysaccharide export outer membrane protein